MSHKSVYVYVAVSPTLLDWAASTIDGYPLKVGTAASISDRERTLRYGFMREGRQWPPCCGCRDWLIKGYTLECSRAVAEDLEARFKSAFERFDPYVKHPVPWKLSELGGGESDLFLLPRDPLRGDLRTAMQKDVGDLYDKARVAVFEGMKASSETPAGMAVNESHDGDDHDELVRDFALWRRDVEDDEREALARSDRSSEEGVYYED